MFNGILSRRDFLKLGSATLLSLLFSELRLDSVQAAPAPSKDGYRPPVYLSGMPRLIAEEGHDVEARRPCGYCRPGFWR